MNTAIPVTNGIEPAVEILAKTEAALGELHQYYKFDRYSGVFPEKPYFLFSHCGHLLFSLWLIEADGPAHILEGDSRLSDIFQQLDFNKLRYSDYKRRMLHADAYEEHLQNEPVWFKLWIDALHVLDESTVASSIVFPQRVLECTMQYGFMEGKLNAKRKQMLHDLARSGEAGRLILRSIWVMEDVVSAIAAHVSTLRSGRYGVARVEVLTGLLQRLRRTVILESTAQGPYALGADRTWGLPSKWARFSRNRTPGSLMVAPRDEGGAIECTYTSQAGQKRKTRCWAQDVACLTAGYEDVLFQTWSYDAGRYRGSADDSTDSRACWLIEDLEANHLEAIAQQADGILEDFASDSQCEVFAESVASVFRAGQSQWEAKRLPWTYIRQIDRLVKRLRFVSREAKVLGGEDPVPTVVARMWSAKEPAAEAIAG